MDLQSFADEWLPACDHVLCTLCRRCIFSPSDFLGDSAVAISDQAFADAQKEELENWSSEAENPARVLRALSEHTEAGTPLRQVLGSTRVRRALEVGIGPFGIGFLAIHLADHIDAIDGLEPLPRLELQFQDQSLTRYIHDIQKRVNYVVSAAEVMPFESNTYDLVACINVLDHTQDPERILREIDRVLKPGGLFVFGMTALSLLGEVKWKINRRRHPKEFIYVAHPHTFQWSAADRFLGKLNYEVLWNDRPPLTTRLAGHGRMYSWILRKSR